MHRYIRTVIAALALLLLIAGAAAAAPGEKGLEHRDVAAASHQPRSDDPQESEAQEPSDVDTTDVQKLDEQNVAGDDTTGPSAKLLDRIVESFADAGVETDADTVAGLAADYGVGGAVRILAWADAAGVDPSEITGLRDGGMGWGQIAKQLNAADDSLDLSPGVGHVMSKGHGKGGDQPHGNSAEAPGHNK
jgi:hypothetical protein